MAHRLRRSSPLTVLSLLACMACSAWAKLSPNRIAVAADSVYWTDSNFIGKAPRP